MDKKLTSCGSLWPAVAAIVIGLLFVIWPGNVIQWAVLFIGIISLLAGIIQVIVYFTNRNREGKQQSGLLWMGILTLVWGALLLLQPAVWVNLFMVVMSVPMILLAISQLVLLVRKRRSGFIVPWVYYIFPVLLLLAGITVMFNPFVTAVWLVFFVGIWVLAYGVVEMISSFSLRKS